MTEPLDELLEWLHTFDKLQFSCNHRNVIEKIWQIKSKQQLLIQRVSNSSEHKERIEAYKECFETYIPNDKWDEATLFLSTYGSGLAKELAKKQL